VLILNGVPAAFTVIERGCVSVFAAASVTVTVKLKGEPVAVVGVPEITPAELSVNPAGREPTVTAHDKGKVPLMAASVTGPYTLPTVPAASGEVVVIVNTGAGFTIIESAFVAVLAVGVVASVTVTVKFEVAAVVGAPEITPAEVIVNPAGSVPVVTAHE
jgi:hypothetical protein